MIDLWPWFVMGIGIATLFAYRYVSNKIDELHISGISKNENTPTPHCEISGDIAANIKVDDINVNGVKKAGVELQLEVEKARLDAYSAREIKVANPQMSLAIGHDWMPMAISLLVLLSALFVILSNNNYADAQQKWAFGAVGTILGYWLKR